MRIGTVETQRLRGIGDKAAGVGREFVGVLLGNNSMQEAGERQQERATEELRALRKQVEAEAHEQRATVAERRERAAQRAKD